MLKTFVLIASLLFSGIAYGGSQVIKTTTRCNHCNHGWILSLYECECGSEDCEPCYYYSECPYCGVLKDNRLVVPFEIRRTSHWFLEQDYKEWRNNRLNGLDTLNPSGWLVPSFKK